MLCSYLATTLEWILYYGSRRMPDHGLWLQRLVFNCCLLLSITFVMLLGLLFCAFGQYSLLWNAGLPLLGLLGIIILFAHQRYFLLARVLYLLLNLVTVGFGVYLYGKQSQLSLYCLDLALLPCLLFHRREWPWTAGATGIAFVLFLAMEWNLIGTEQQALLPAMQPYATFLFSLAAFSGITLPSALLLWQSHTGFRRALRRNRVVARDEKFAAIGRLAAGAAHEINNPLAIVQLTLENIENNHAVMRESFVQNRIKRGYEAIYRIHQVLQRLLASTLVPVAPPESWLVRDVAQAISQRCRRFLKPRGIGFSIRSDLPADCRVLCHRQSVIDVVDSLINNSLEAMAGQGKPRIVVTLKCENLHFLVQVEDSGPGLTEEAFRSVFTPFFTSKPSHHGLGLSLYSARCLAQQYGGDLTCDRGPGGRFYLSLPIQSESETLGRLVK